MRPWRLSTPASSYAIVVLFTPCVPTSATLSNRVPPVRQTFRLSEVTDPRKNRKVDTTPRTQSKVYAAPLALRIVTTGNRVSNQ